MPFHKDVTVCVASGNTGHVSKSLSVFGRLCGLNIEQAPYWSYFLVLLFRWLMEFAISDRLQGSSVQKRQGTLNYGLRTAVTWVLFSIFTGRALFLILMNANDEVRDLFIQR